MVTRDLLRELEGRGVRLIVNGGRLVARGPSGALTPELSERIRVQKAALLRELQSKATGTPSPLPEPLVRLICAAAGDHLNRPAFLPSGIVPNLGGYVLACAAYYAAGMEPDRQVNDLWAAHAAWSH